MLPIWRDNWLFLLLDEKNSRERDVPERLLVEPMEQPFLLNYKNFLCINILTLVSLSGLCRFMLQDILLLSSFMALFCPSGQ